MRVTDDQLSDWTKPAFGNEEQLATNTEQAIRSAVEKHTILSNMNLRFIPKGSFKNNTNVRRDSDIDIAIVHKDHVATDYVEGATQQDAGLVPYTGLSKYDFKAAVGEAMCKEFGSAAVDGSGNKVFRIRGSQKVLDADVIPSTQYWYIGKTWQRKGIGLILDRPDGKTHFNYPDHHFDNGIAKNNTTGRRYKRAVRIMKNMENKLVEEGRIQPFPSFLVECLAYNTPDYIYNTATSWRELITNIAVHIWGYVKTTEEPAERQRWREVNGHKYLFGDHQHWTKQDAHNFILQIFGMVTE
jgi:hypothetical protein